MPARPLLALYCAALSAGALAERIDKTPLEAVWRRSVACHPSGAAEKAAAAPGCVAADCHVAVYDGFLNATTVQTLREIADAGVARTAPGDRAASAAGGPTIMDINSGYVMIPGQRLVNVYERAQKARRPKPVFSQAQFGVYKGVIDAITDAVTQEFGLTEVHFSAPTFITRTMGTDGWEPTATHDEYWHLHVDKNNTAHYDYSGLLYLNEYGEDFDGGLLTFHDNEDGDEAPDLEIEPLPGRLLLFTAGREHPHRVGRVTRGTRYVLSFWFSCDASKAFGTFLDGKVHGRFGEEL